MGRQAFIGLSIFLYFIYFTTVDAQAPPLSWQHQRPVVVLTPAQHEQPLLEVLTQFVHSHSKTPSRLIIDESLNPLHVHVKSDIQASSPQAGFQWLLSRYDLALAPQQTQWRIVKRTELWKYTPYRKWIADPVSMVDVLDELSRLGQVSIHFDRTAFQSFLLQQNIEASSVYAALHQLAQRWEWFIDYDTTQHTVFLLSGTQVVTQSLTLTRSDKKAVRAFLNNSPELKKLVQRSQVYYPHPKMVMLRGSATVLETLSMVITEFDASFQKTTPTVQRFPLRYLHVANKKVTSEGETLQSQGIEKQLLALFQQHSPENPPSILLDLPSNALVVHGTVEQLHLIEEVLAIWDQPQALIKIEAHIFETSKSFSRQLGLEFSAQGLPLAEGESDIPGLSSFTAAMTLGPLNTTKAFRVDTLLRALETEGKGRVLSRPSVVTNNNVEAEMNSGSTIHVKLRGAGKNPTKLKQIKTGVTLRVTPRVIVEEGTEEPEYKIRLHVFAETSSPISDVLFDDLPPIQSQSAKSQVIVNDGEPFLLGGLIKNQSNESESGIPFLKDIPLLGALFKTEFHDQRFDHVMVFITPTLLGNRQ